MTKKYRILIADDEETFLLSTADLLRNEGYDCTCVSNGDDAIEKLNQESFDLLISDIKMPGNADLRLIEEVEKQATGMPVILVTGYPSINSAIKSVRLPVVDYVLKPIEFEQLCVTVKAAINRYSAYQMIQLNRQRLQDSAEELRKVEESFPEFAQDASEFNANAFLDTTVRNIVASLSDLRSITQVMSLDSAAQSPCHLMNCPKPIELTRALEDAVTVLERSKSSFKSKELGEFRKRLETSVQKFGVKLGDAIDT